MLAALLSQLSRVRSIRDRTSQRIRDRLLRKPLDFGRTSEKQLLKLHDLLLFEIAHQESPALRRIIEAQLIGLHKFVTKKVKANCDYLLDSGMAGTYRVDSFSRTLLSALATYPTHLIKIDWDHNGSCGPSLDDFLRECIMTTEGDSVLHETVSTRQLLSTLLLKSRTRELPWLLNEIETVAEVPQIKDRLYNSLEIWIKWRSAKRGWSRTFLRFPRHARVRSHSPTRVSISSQASSALLDTCRGALASRGKETDTVTYSDKSLLTLYSCEQKLDVALFELQPARRLPIETYVGFVSARNRIPVAYGGAWILGYRAEIGLNIFEEFRGGNSHQLFASILDVYKLRYSIKVFIVHPTQFGDDNEEALNSGAFWFYYRFGFRPDDEKLCQLAESEALKRRADSGYRSSRRTMKRLSKQQLVLSFGSSDQNNDLALVTQKLGYALVSQIGARFGGDREKAKQHANKLWRAIGGGRTQCPEISLLLCLLSDLQRWSAVERHALKLALSLKTAKHEGPFVRAIQRHTRLRQALRVAAGP